MQRLCFASVMVLWVGIPTIAMKPRGKIHNESNTTTEQNEPAAPSDLDDPDLRNTNHRNEPVVNTQQQRWSFIASETRKQTHKPGEPREPGYSAIIITAPKVLKSELTSGTQARKHRSNHFNAPKINHSFTSWSQKHVYSLSQLKVLLIASSQSLFIHVCFRKQPKKRQNVILIKCCTHLYTTQGDDTRTHTHKMKNSLTFCCCCCRSASAGGRLEREKRERQTRLVQCDIKKQTLKRFRNSTLRSNNKLIGQLINIHNKGL